MNFKFGHYYNLLKCLTSTRYLQTGNSILFMIIALHRNFQKTKKQNKQWFEYLAILI